MSSEVAEPFSLSYIEILGGLRSFGANDPARLSFALHLETGLPGNTLLEALKASLEYGEPGQWRIVLRIPASLANEKLGTNIRSEFPPLLNSEDERAMYDFQDGRWGDEGQKLVDWIRSSYQTAILPALSQLTSSHRHLELELGRDGIRAKAAAGP